LTLYTDPHLEARGFFKEVTHQEAGTHRYPGMGFQLFENTGGLPEPTQPTG